MDGFPRLIWQWFNADADPAGKAKAFAAAETLRDSADPPLSSGASVQLFERQQDEYCEWHVDRNSTGGIARITFTSEGPEYFERIAAVDLTLVGDLYREHVNPAVQDAELVWPEDVRNDRGDIVFARGSYNKWNVWNTRKGAMHLTHQANTLGAEINLAADATVQFPVPQSPANTLPFRLICCARFGGVNRSSDPLIGAGVNGLARSGLAVTRTIRSAFTSRTSASADCGIRRHPDPRDGAAHCAREPRSQPDPPRRSAAAGRRDVHTGSVHVRG